MWHEILKIRIKKFFIWKSLVQFNNSWLFYRSVLPVHTYSSQSFYCIAYLWSHLMCTPLWNVKEKRSARFHGFVLRANLFEIHFAFVEVCMKSCTREGCGIQIDLPYEIMCIKSRTPLWNTYCYLPQGNVEFIWI